MTDKGCYIFGFRPPGSVYDSFTLSVTLKSCQRPTRICTHTGVILTSNTYRCINLVHHDIHINVFSWARIQLFLSRHKISCYNNYVYMCTTFKHQLYCILASGMHYFCGLFVFCTRDPHLLSILNSSYTIVLS